LRSIATYTHTYTNIDTYTVIHPIIVVARVLALTHTAKDCFEDVISRVNKPHLRV